MLRTVFRRSRWLSPLLLVALLVTMLAVPVAAVGPEPLTGQELIQLLQTYGVVKGDERGNLNLDKPITRAEMMTILVRAIGKDSEADLYKGLGAFTDAKGHWAEGYITYAAMKNLVKGDGNNTVRPNDQINWAEALTLILRLVGKEPTTGDWPTNVIFAAADLGLIPAGVTAANIREAAIRGPIFQSMATSLVTVKSTNGKTYLAEYLAKEPPVLTVNPVSDTTTDASVTVSGTVKGAKAVTVNGTTVPVSGTGFSKTVDLSFGANAVVVTAIDIAGNTSTKELSIVRKAQVARIDVTGTASLGIGSSATITAKAYDASGKELTDVDLTTSSTGVGSYSASTKTFTAGDKAGTATITFKAGDLSKAHTITVHGPSDQAKRLQFATGSFTMGQNDVIEVQVRVLNDKGEVVTTDYGRPIGLTASGISGINVLPMLAKTEAGIATFKVSGTSAGNGVLSATSQDLPSSSTTVSIYTAVRVVLTASPNTLIASTGATSIVRAQLLDANNAPFANNTGTDVVVQIYRNGVGDGSLTSNTLYIKPGASTSAGFDASYVVGQTAGTLIFTGQIVSGQPFSVVPAELTMTNWAAGGGGGGGGGTAGPAVKLQLIGTGVDTDPNGGVADLIVRVVDSNGNSVVTGNYAFTIKATTNNNERLVNGLPEGLNITLGTSGYRPVADSTGVTGVTVNGIARLQVTYTKSGVVRLEPVGAYTSTGGRDDSGTLVNNPASTTGLTMAPTELRFKNAAGATALALTGSHTSNTWLNYSGATVAPVPVNGSVTLTASLRDATGGIVPGASASVVELYQVGKADPIAVKSIVNGTVDFTVAGPTSAGSAQYHVKAGALQSAAVTIVANSTALPTPVIVSTRGASDAGPGLPDTVRNSDQYLQFLVNPTSVPNQHGVVKVFRSGGGNPIYTTPVMDLSSGIIIVNVPKALVTNQETYRLTFDNGAGNSPLSANSNKITIQSTIQVNISSATYDATSHKLTINASHYGYQGTLDATKLLLTASNGTTFRPSIGSVTSSGTFVLDLTSDPNRISVLENPTVFRGEVRLTTSDGWLIQSTGEVAQAIAAGSNVSVAPFAAVTRSYLDPANRKLTIDTVGAANGYFDLKKFSVGGVALNDPSNSISATPGKIGRYTINLTATQATTLAASPGPLTVDTGWYYTGWPTQSVAGHNVAIYAPIEVSSATLGNGVLTLYGSGFLKLTPTNLTLTKITLTNEATADSYTLTDSITSGISIVTDGMIQITLGTNDASALGTTRFNGNLVFLTTTPGWATDGTRTAPTVDSHQVGVGFTN